MNLHYIEIVSWENDGDNVQTNRYFSTQYDSLKWIKEYVQLFKPSSLYGECYGNESLEDDLLLEITEEYIIEHGVPIELVIKTDKEHIRDFIRELMGVSEYYSYKWIRALSNVEIKTITSRELDNYLNFKSKI